MKFRLLDIIPYRADPITGRQVSSAERFAVEVARVLRRELPTTLWRDEDRGAGGLGTEAAQDVVQLVARQVVTA